MHTGSFQCRPPHDIQEYNVFPFCGRCWSEASTADTCNSLENDEVMLDLCSWAWQKSCKVGFVLAWCTRLSPYERQWNIRTITYWLLFDCVSHAHSLWQNFYSIHLSHINSSSSVLKSTEAPYCLQISHNATTPPMMESGLVHQWPQLPQEWHLLHP